MKLFISKQLVKRKLKEAAKSRFFIASNRNIVSQKDYLDGKISTYKELLK